MVEESSQSHASEDEESRSLIDSTSEDTIIVSPWSNDIYGKLEFELDQFDDLKLSSLDLEEGGLPSPVTTPCVTPKRRLQLSATIIVLIWMAWSTSVILFNNYIFNTLHFRYPVFLVTSHLAFATVATRVLQFTTRLLDAADEMPVDLRMFARSILPIGILYSGSLILGNKAYLYLSVPFIQMLKAFVPVSVILLAFLFRLQEPSKRLLLIVLSISLGVALTSYGEVGFNLLGFAVQATSVFLESARLIMIERLLRNVRMDPLVSLHYYAPVCVVVNLLVFPFTEGWAPLLEWEKIGWTIFAANLGVAFFLNVASVFLLGVAGGLVLTLSGVLKDILLIVGSVVIFGGQISSIQVIGYSIAFVGLLVFKTFGR